MPMVLRDGVGLVFYGDDAPAGRPLGPAEDLEWALLEAGLAMERDLLEERLRDFERARGLQALSEEAVIMRDRHTARLAAAAAHRSWRPAPRSPAERRAIGRIERADPRLDRLVPRDAVIEVLAEGFRWSEGPVWDRAGAGFSSRTCRTTSCTPGARRAGSSPFLKPSGYTGPEGGGGREPGANGLAFDAQGRLVLCQHGDRRISRLEGGRFVPLVERFEGKRFNSPNDLVFAGDGAIYFTDPPYGLTKTFDDPGREIGWNGVYRLAPGRPGERAGEGPQGAQRHRPLARRPHALRRPVRRRTGRS